MKGKFREIWQRAIIEARYRALLVLMVVEDLIRAVADWLALITHRPMKAAAVEIPVGAREPGRRG